MSKQRKSRGFIPGFPTSEHHTAPRHGIPELAMPHHALPHPTITTKVTSISPLPFSCTDAGLYDTSHKGFLDLSGDSSPPGLTLAHDDNGTCEVRQSNHNSDIYPHHAHTPTGVTDAISQEASCQTRETNHSNRQLEITLPYLIEPFPTPPKSTVSNLCEPRRSHKGTSPHHTVPERALPHRNTAYLALTNTTKLFTHIKASNHKTTKAGAIVTNTNGFTSEGKHIIDNLKMEAVINNGDGEVKFPTGFECRADSDNTSAVHNHRAQVQVQRLIAICIKFFGDFHTKGDFIRGNKYGRLEQVLVSLTPLALNFEIDRRANHRAFKVGSWLEYTGVICVKILTPLLSVINRASLLFAPLAHRGKFGHREFMMQHRGSTNNRNINLIHDSPHRTQKALTYVRKCLAIGRARDASVSKGRVFSIAMNVSGGKGLKTPLLNQLLDTCKSSTICGGVNWQTA